MEINTVGTKNLLEALNLTNLKNFVYISTFHVYGLTEGDIDENTELNPKNDYALTHLFAEFYTFFKFLLILYKSLKVQNWRGMLHSELGKGKMLVNLFYLSFILIHKIKNFI